MATSKNSKSNPVNIKSKEVSKSNNKRDLIIGAIALVCITLIIVIVLVSRSGNNSDTFNNGQYYADIVIKDYGTITVSLDTESAPETVENFVALANDGFYDGLTFHRIIEGFMMQGGDPNGNGTGGSGKNVIGEFSANGYENNISHVRGTISMARSSDYNSASSQFFIVQQDSTYLDGQYAGFGTVVEGMDIVDSICESAAPTDSNGSISTEDQPVIETITIRSADAE